MKKAFHWFEIRNIEYQFYDYKKYGIDVDTLTDWCEKVDWTILLNKRGLSWRKLSCTDKQNIDQNKAIHLMIQNPSLIKRPVLEFNGNIKVGFSPTHYTAIFER